jgi:hypothetical protein
VEFRTLLEEESSKGMSGQWQFRFYHITGAVWTTLWLHDLTQWLYWCHSQYGASHGDTHRVLSTHMSGFPLVFLSLVYMSDQLRSVPREIGKKKALKFNFCWPCVGSLYSWNEIEENNTCQSVELLRMSAILLLDKASILLKWQLRKWCLSARWRRN